jgi:hypothetical protein
MLRLPHFQTFGWQMAARLSALRAGRFLPPGKFLVLISVRGWVDPQGHGAAEKFTSSGTRTGVLPACSIVPQRTTLPRAPISSISPIYISTWNRCSCRYHAWLHFIYFTVITYIYCSYWRTLKNHDFAKTNFFSLKNTVRRNMFILRIWHVTSSDTERNGQRICKLSSDASSSISLNSLKRTRMDISIY